MAEGEGVRVGATLGRAFAKAPGEIETEVASGVEEEEHAVAGAEEVEEEGEEEEREGVVAALAGVVPRVVLAGTIPGTAMKGIGRGGGKAKHPPTQRLASMPQGRVLASRLIQPSFSICA